MAQGKTNLAFKITNWCNLNCWHCCENSGPQEDKKLMSLDKMADYLEQFNALTIAKYDTLVFTGGEVMSPYFMHNDSYIPHCIQIAAKGNMLPVLKTNGTWGGKAIQNKIFSSIADSAYMNNKLVAIDLSVDRFHKNIANVADIIETLVKNPDLGFCIATTLQGIFRNSTHAIMDLLSALKPRGISVLCKNSADETVILTDGTNLYPLFYNFNQSVASLGRAKTNNLGVFTPTGKADVFGDCVMIDGNDILAFNNIHRTPINNRPIAAVIKELKQKAR